MKKLSFFLLLLAITKIGFSDGTNPSYNNGKGILKHQFNNYIVGADIKSIEVFQLSTTKSYRAAKTTRFQQTVLFIQCFDELLNPDSSFGINGELYLSFPQNFIFSKVCIGSNQTILVAGSDSSVTLRDVYLAKYFSNGTIDSSFGNGGILKKPFTYLNDYVQDIALQSDGKIAMLTNDALGENFKVYRFNANGETDSSFNTNGVSSIDFGSADLAQKLYILPNNHIWVVGKVFLNGKAKIGISKLLSNGILDSSFAQNGKSIEVIGTKDDLLLDLVVLPNGNVLAITQIEIVSTTNAAIQWKVDGRREDNFGINGVLNLQWNSFKGAESDTSGNLYVYNRFSIRKYQPNGSIDTTFFIDYYKAYNGTDVDLVCIHKQQLLVLGLKPNNLIKYDYNNELSYHAFDLAGNQNFNAFKGGGFIKFIGNVIANKSKIVLLATASNNQGEMICLANSIINPLQLFLVKFMSDGKRDSSFGQNGLIYLNINQFRDNAFSLRFINDNKFLLAYAESNMQAQLHGYLANGTLDSSFATNGKSIFSLANAGFIKLFTDEQDRIVLAGNRFLRFLANGQLDPSLNFQVLGGLKAAMVLKDGKFLVGGNFGIKKIESNGDLDVTFGINGYFTDTIINFRNQKLSFVCTDLSYDYRGLMVLASGTYYSYVNSPRYDIGTFLLSEDGKVNKNIFRNPANLNSSALHLALPNNAGLVSPTKRIEDFTYSTSGIVQFKNHLLNDSFNVTGKIELVQDIFANGSYYNNVKSCAFGAYHNNNVLLLRVTDSAFFISEITVTPDNKFPYNQMSIYASNTNIAVNQEIYLTLNNSIFPHQKRWILPDSIGTFVRGTNTQSDTCYVRFNKPGIYDIYLDYILSDTTVKLQALQFIRVMSVGLSEEALNQIQIYPNPSNGEVMLNLGGSEIKRYQILDLLGKTYRTEELSMDFNHLIKLPEPSGMYILQLVDLNGQLYNYKVLRD